MITAQYLLEHKEDADMLSEQLKEEDIAFLVSLLEEKEDALRYAAFLALKARSQRKDDVYPFWDTLAQKLQSENSYQRSIGIMLLSENVRHDAEKKLDTVLQEYLFHCGDAKFITARQTLQSIAVWISLRPDLVPTVAKSIANLDFSFYKENQRRLLKKDADAVAALCKKI